MKRNFVYLLFMLLLTINFTHADHIVVDQWDYVPQISIVVDKDSMSGWNLHILSENFVFDPANAGNVHQVGHGHAHLYINDIKVARVYSNWYHLPATLFTKGMNKVTVSLNANTHEGLYLRGAPVLATVMVHFDGVVPGSGHHGH